MTGVILQKSNEETNRQNEQKKERKKERNIRQNRHEKKKRWGKECDRVMWAKGQGQRSHSHSHLADAFIKSDVQGREQSSYEPQRPSVTINTILHKKLKKCRNVTTVSAS